MSGGPLPAHSLIPASSLQPVEFGIRRPELGIEGIQALISDETPKLAGRHPCLAAPDPQPVKGIAHRSDLCPGTRDGILTRGGVFSRNHTALTATGVPSGRVTGAIGVDLPESGRQPLPGAPKLCQFTCDGFGSGCLGGLLLSRVGIIKDTPLRFDLDDPRSIR